MVATVRADERERTAADVVELADLLHEIVRSSLRRLHPALGEEGITMGQFWALHLVSSREAASVSTVARHLGVSAPTVCANVDQLAAAGLVRRHRSERDRRSVTLSLTPLGRRVEARVWNQVAGRIADATEGIPPADLGTAVRVFRDLERRLRSNGGTRREAA